MQSTLARKLIDGRSLALTWPEISASYLKDHLLGQEYSSCTTSVSLPRGLVRRGADLAYKAISIALLDEAKSGVWRWQEDPKPGTEVSSSWMALDDANFVLSPFTATSIFDAIKDLSAGQTNLWLEPANDVDSAEPTSLADSESVKGISQRLGDLSEEASSDGISISLSSKADLWKFVATAAPSRRPSLSLLDTGTIRAVWKNTAKEQVAVHFKGDGSANYVLFYLREENMVRDYGTGKIEHVRELITEQKLWRLLANEG
jgi:hypothetical protein